MDADGTIQLVASEGVLPAYLKTCLSPPPILRSLYGMTELIRCESRVKRVVQQ